jgi:hypothetical protein
MHPDERPTLDELRAQAEAVLRDGHALRRETRRALAAAQALWREIHAGLDTWYAAHGGGGEPPRCPGSRPGHLRGSAGLPDALPRSSAAAGAASPADTDGLVPHSAPRPTGHRGKGRLDSCGRQTKAQ